MVVHCTYCKKEVIRGMDSHVDKNGYLESFHASCRNIMKVLESDYECLLSGKVTLQRRGVSHCTYCKKEIIRGVDSPVKRNGYLRGYHKSCNREMTALNIQYAHLLLGKVCVCCGLTENIEAGHINSPEDKIRKACRGKFGFTVTSGDSISCPYFINLVLKHVIVPLCVSCNKSMGKDTICRLHRKDVRFPFFIQRLDEYLEKYI